VGGLTQRGFPLPGVCGWAAIFSEFVGGLLLAVGLLTRPAAAFVLATLAVAAFYVHAADPFQRKELALAYVLVSIAVLIAGPGRFSIDALVASRFRQSACG
jgi:putative oxidoreductase